MCGSLCYQSAYGLDDLFKKVKALDWVALETETPTSKNRWGSRNKSAHLKEGDGDYRVEIHVEGKKIYEFKWENQREASGKSMPAKYWDGFLEAAKKEFPEVFKTE